MDPKKTEDDISDSLRHRVYFAARDGMPLTLYDLLNEKTTEEIDDLLNQVGLFLVCFLSLCHRRVCQCHCPYFAKYVSHLRFQIFIYARHPIICHKELRN